MEYQEWKAGGSFGEFSGYSGGELDVGRITCAFCEERGNFAEVSHYAKKQANGSKQLNFDTLECGNCKGYVLVLWSSGNMLHDFHVLPWPLAYNR